MGTATQALISTLRQNPSLAREFLNTFQSNAEALLSDDGRAVAELLKATTDISQSGEMLVEEVLFAVAQTRDRIQELTQMLLREIES